MFRRRRHRQPRSRLRIRPVQTLQGGVLRRRQPGAETPARLPLRSRQGAGVARLQRHDRHPDADALGLRQGERRVRPAQREAAAADRAVPDHHLLALRRERRADIQRHAPRRQARRRSRRPAGPRPDGRCRTARKSALHHPQGPFGLHRDARHPCGKQTVYVRRDRFHQPHRKTGRDQRTDDLQDAAHEVLDPFRRGRRHVRLPDLVARMRHAAFAQGRQLQNDAVRDLRQEQAAAGDQQAAQEPRLRHRGQQDHRNEGRRHALRGRRVYPRLLRAVRNLEGARRPQLVFLRRKLPRRHQLGLQQGPRPVGHPARRGGTLQRPRGEDHAQRLRIPGPPARGHRPAHAADRALSGFAQRRQPARIRSLDRARQEPERAEAHPHGAQQGVPPPDPHADADLRADRPCAQGAQPDHSGHLALRGELYRGRDHRPQNRTSEAYPPL